MSWIEGVGDEVTVIVAILLVLLVISVAWVSTGIRDIPFIRVIVVQLRQRRRRQRASQGGTSDPLVQTSTPEADVGSSTANDSVTGDEQVNSEHNTVSSDQVVSQDNIHDTDRTESSPNTENVSVSDQSETDHLPNVVSHLPASYDATSTSMMNIDNTENERTGTENTIENLSSPELRNRRLLFFGGSDKHSSPLDSEQHSEIPTEQTCASCSNERTGDHDDVPKHENLPSNSTDLTSQDISSLNAELIASSDNSSTNVCLETETENVTETRDTAGEIRVKLKYLNDTQRSITALPTETIGDFRQKHFSSEISQSKLVRFIFNGQDLRNDASTLQACNIMHNSVVHCLITQPRQQSANNNNIQDDGLFDIGMFMLPLFGILLGILWYMRFMYRQFFNTTSTLTLAGITFMYIAAFMSTLRGRRPHEHLE